MVVTWTTFNSTDESVVEFGIMQLDHRARGNFTKFVDGGSEARVLFIHRVTLTDLHPGVAYSKFSKCH